MRTSNRIKRAYRRAYQAYGNLHLLDTPFGEREKPTGKDFKLCTRSRLLIISPTSPLPFSRESCLLMNLLGESISSH